MTDQAQNTQETQELQPNVTLLQLDLTVDAINVILSALGKLPTDSGVYPLRMMIAEQAQDQLNALLAQQSAESGEGEDAAGSDAAE